MRPGPLAASAPARAPGAVTPGRDWGGAATAGSPPSAALPAPLAAGAPPTAALPGALSVELAAGPAASPDLLPGDVLGTESSGSVHLLPPPCDRFGVQASRSPSPPARGSG